MASQPKRSSAVTGFTIPVGKYRKLTGEPGPDGAKATDCLIVPAGAIGRFPANKWGEFGSVRTYRIWTPARQVPPADVVPSAGVVQPLGNPGPLAVTRRAEEPSSGTRDPCGRRSPLPRMRDLQEEDIEEPDCLCHTGAFCRRPGRKCQTRSPSDLHRELLDVRAEGGSDSSDSWDSSGTSEEVEDGDLSRSDSSSGDEISPGGLGASSRGSTGGLRPAAGRSDSESDIPSGQEDEASASEPDSE